MIGGRLVQREAQKCADGQRVGRVPGDLAFGIDPFEVAEQQQAAVASGLEAWSAHNLRVELAAQAFDESVEGVVRQIDRVDP